MNPNPFGLIDSFINPLLIPPNLPLFRGLIFYVHSSGFIGLITGGLASAGDSFSVCMARIATQPVSQQNFKE